MTTVDTNSIIRSFLVLQEALTDIVSDRIYIPRLPENTDLPALGFFTRGGNSSPYTPGIMYPSIQFDCWGDTPIAARQVYSKLYDVLQGVQNQVVTVGSSDYLLMGAREEVQGQDLADPDFDNYFRVLTFFSMMIRSETT